jgi:DNA-directed RNA polymerase subunit RPC12/RpoP
VTKAARHYCPACGAGLVSEPIGAPLRCKHCGWRLVTLEAWRRLSPFQQGWTLYMQGSWPTSELAQEKNPYAEGAAA